VPRGFPAPDLVLTAIMRSEAAAVQDVAVIHSDSAGVEAGRRSGAAAVVGVLTGPHPAARLRAAGATSVIPSIADLPALLADGAATGKATDANGSNDDARRPADLKSASIEVPPQAPVRERSSDR